MNATERIRKALEIRNNNSVTTPTTARTVAGGTQSHSYLPSSMRTPYLPLPSNLPQNTTVPKNTTVDDFDFSDEFANSDGMTPWYELEATKASPTTYGVPQKTLFKVPDKTTVSALKKFPGPSTIYDVVTPESIKNAERALESLPKEVKGPYDDPFWDNIFETVEQKENVPKREAPIKIVGQDSLLDGLSGALKDPELEVPKEWQKTIEEKKDESYELVMPEGWTDIKKPKETTMKASERPSTYEEYVNLMNSDEMAWKKIVDGRRLTGLKGFKINTSVEDGYLTDEERDVFHYLLASYGREEAENFLKLLDPVLRIRYSEHIQKHGNSFDKTFYTIAGGLANPIVGAYSFGKQLFSDEPVERWAGIDAGEYIRANEPGVFYDVVGTISNMTPSILLSTVTRAPSVGATFTGISAAGNAFNQKIKEGYSPGEARIFSYLIGAAEGGMEYALSGITKLSGGKITGAVANKIAAIENGLLRASVDLSSRGISEVAEEEIQLFLEPLIATIVLGEEYDAPTIEEMIDTAVVSYITTGIMEVPGVTHETYSGQKVDTEIGSYLRKDGIDIDGEITAGVINTGLSSDPKSNAYKFSRELWKRAESGKEISDRQLGHAYRENLVEVEKENNTASKIETANKLTNSPGYMIDTSPAPLLRGEEMANYDSVEAPKKYNVFNPEGIKINNELEKRTIESAVNIGMNNTRDTHSLVETAAKISSESGIPITFTTGAVLNQMGYDVKGREIGGVYTPQGILINAESSRAGQAILGHELVHWLQKNGLYKTYNEAITSYAEEIGVYDSTRTSTSELYKNKADADIDLETTADLTGTYLFTDEAFVSRLTEHHNLFQRIYDKIRHYYNMATANSPEARLLERAKYTFEKAYRKQSGKVGDFKANGNFSIVEPFYDNNGNYYDKAVLLDTDFFDDLSPRNWGRKLEKYLFQRTDDSPFIMPIIDEKGNVQQLQFARSNETVKKQGHSRHHVLDELAMTNDNISKLSVIHIDEIIEISEENNPYYTSENTHGWLDANGWLHRNAYVINAKNGAIYNLTVDIAKAKDGRTILYATKGKINRVGQAEVNSLIKRGSGPHPNSASILTQPASNVNSEFALYPENDSEQDINSLSESERIQQIREYMKAQSENPSESSNAFEAEKKMRQAKYDDLIDLRYAIEQKFNNVISHLELKRKGMRNPDTTKSGVELAQRIIKQKGFRDEALSKIDKDIKKAKQKLEGMDKKEYSRIEQRRKKGAEHTDLIAKTVGTTASWKDKKTGARYELNTLRRNLRDIVRKPDGTPDIEKADAIYELLQGRYSRHEAQMMRTLARFKKPFADMNINNSESVYIQMLGEYRYNPDTTLSENEVREYYNKNKDSIDLKKVEKAISMARESYDILFNKLNEVLREQGLKEIPYREGYFPHFEEPKPGFFAKLLNWKSKNDAIPTDIAGLTEDFNPEKSYQSFDKKREGDTTDYNFLKGFDKYLYGALDWIYHIDDIQLRRAFEDYIRYEHSDKAMRDSIDEIRSEGLDPEQERVLIDEAVDLRKHKLGNFITSFRGQTNVLAGKKHSFDRAFENFLGRGMYTAASNVSSRINANMVAGSISSALTNFIPLTQSWAEVSPLSTLFAMKDTIKAHFKGDGIVEKSDFLTNRLLKDKKLYETGWDKTVNKMGLLMEAIDSFTSETIWRSKFSENMKNGMSEAEAIKNADRYCEGLMASRSRGEMPGVFDHKNIASKIITSFQLEVNNQYGYLFKDLPQSKTTKGGIVWGLTKMFIGAFAFNWLFKRIAGREPALDPIGIIADVIEDINDEDENALSNLGVNLAEQLPIIGSFIGGGRLPISSALPNFDNIHDFESGAWELGKPLAYLALPGGGGQLYKTAKGIDTIAKGGSYKTNSKGEEILQYPFYSDEGASSFFQGAKSLILGKNSTPAANEWIEKNFNSFGVNQTAAYQGMIAAGDGQRESFEFIDSLREIKDPKEKRQALLDSSFSDDGKFAVYYNMLSNKNENNPEKDERYTVLDKLENKSTVNVILKIRTAEDNHEKVQALSNADLSLEDEKLIFKEYISEDGYEEASSLNERGVSYDLYFDAYFEYDKIKAQTEDNKERRSNFARYINGLNISDSDKALLREAFIGESNTTYDKLVAERVPDEQAFDIGESIDALKPDRAHGHTTVQTYQKYRVIINADLSSEDTARALKAVSSESQSKKIEQLAKKGIDLGLYVDLFESIGLRGKNISEISNSELKVWINMLSPPPLGLDAKYTWPRIKEILYEVLKK